MPKASMIQTRYLGLLGALALAGAASASSSGCTATSANNTGTGGAPAGMGGAGGDAVGGSSIGGMSGSVGMGGVGGGPPMNCTNVTSCGGDIVGTWNVQSSCLLLQGEMDVFLTSLACSTVPATGYLETTGSITFNEDGTYFDETTTIGTVTFPLVPECMTISGVPATCDRVASIFASVGWTSGSCTEGGGTCNCSLTANQEAGLGQVLSFTEERSTYSADGTTLELGTEASYAYCGTGDTLTLTPQMDALVGSVTLQRSGAAGMGGMGGMGGSAGMGGMGGSAGMGGTAGMGGASGMGGTGGTGVVGGERPCDIYEAAGLSCAAAHSTVRALYGAYDGPLYQVERQDGQTQDITTLSPGGFADSAAQDSFCSGTTCRIMRLYDQTGNGNVLVAQIPGVPLGPFGDDGFDGQTAADAAAETVNVGGNKVYSVYTRPRQAYWNDGSQTGMPTGAEPQSVYMVTSGTHFNSGCCYNYGNGQLDRDYNGGPMMDSVYFGNNTIWGTGAGNGPWVMADMEDGMLSGGTPGVQNPNNISLPHPFVTAMEKNNGTDTFALKGADATVDGPLTTMWDGDLPGSKRPMQKQGAVLLGAGGDCCYSNNNASEGTFYEGAIVAGYADAATDEAIHANIVETGYGE